MNKYQMAFMRFLGDCSKAKYFKFLYGYNFNEKQWEEDKKLIQELVDKATANKPIYSDFEENDDGDGIIPTRAECPYCGYEFEFGTWNESENHHCVCGQAIDWSSNDD